jgi:hypothetical protein
MISDLTGTAHVKGVELYITFRQKPSSSFEQMPQNLDICSFNIHQSLSYTKHVILVTRVFYIVHILHVELLIRWAIAYRREDGYETH